MKIDEQITVIRNFVSVLRGTVATLSAEQLTRVYIDSEWTIAQIVHHLFDAHTNAYQLCKRVLSEDNAGLSWPDQDVVANLPDGKSANIESSLMGLEGLHMRWADMFSNVEDWESAGVSIKSGKTYTIARLLEMYAGHCNNHIEQINTVKQAIS